MNRSKRLSAVVVGALIVAASVLFTDPASAATGSTGYMAAPQLDPKPPAGRSTISITATRTAAADAGTWATADIGAQSAIVCTASVDDPHKSSHQPGTINAIARVSCTAPVAQIWINEQRLEVYGYPITRASGNNSGQAYLGTNAWAGCATAIWSNAADVWVQFPPNYNPITQSGTVISPQVYIEC
jgi:hypothetical protein